MQCADRQTGRQAGRQAGRHQWLTYCRTSPNTAAQVSPELQKRRKKPISRPAHTYSKHRIDRERERRERERERERERRALREDRWYERQKRVIERKREAEGERQRQKEGRTHWVS